MGHGRREAEESGMTSDGSRSGRKPTPVRSCSANSGHMTRARCSIARSTPPMSPATAESLGWAWSYWQFDSDFILYNIDEDHWTEPIKQALVP